MILLLGGVERIRRCAGTPVAASTFSLPALLDFAAHCSTASAPNFPGSAHSPQAQLGAYEVNAAIASPLGDGHHMGK
jgi:hypothetical protein